MGARLAHDSLTFTVPVATMTGISAVPSTGIASRAPRAAQPFRWVEPIKGFAILAVVIVHVQAAIYDRTPWVLQASQAVPNLWEQPDLIFPPHSSIWLTILHFLSMLGGSAPGVFILLSGLTVTWSALHTTQNAAWVKHFYVRRAWRIFPYYIAAHLLDLALALVLPGSQLQLEWPQVLFSLLGLRFTSELFSYFDPAWWFIWLILQLYLVFPLLLWMMRKLGLGWFLSLTFGLTFVCRGWGVETLMNLQHWDMGISFVTRLAEFTVGMAVAQWIFARRRIPAAAKTPSIGLLFWWTLGVYLTGLLAATTVHGTIVSALLISVGMTGLFWCAAELLLSRSRISAQVLRWIGVHSYGIYLLHFLPFKWMVDLNPGSPRMQLLSFVGVFAGACLAAWILERMVSFLVHRRPRPGRAIPYPRPRTA